MPSFDIVSTFDIQEVDNISFFDPSTKFFEGTQSMPTVDSIFSDNNIDAVVICSPNAPKKMKSSAAKPDMRGRPI